MVLIVLNFLLISYNSDTLKSGYFFSKLLFYLPETILTALNEYCQRSVEYF